MKKNNTIMRNNDYLIIQSLIANPAVRCTLYAIVRQAILQNYNSSRPLILSPLGFSVH